MKKYLLLSVLLLPQLGFAHKTRIFNLTQSVVHITRKCQCCENCGNEVVDEIQPDENKKIPMKESELSQFIKAKYPSFILLNTNREEQKTLVACSDNRE